MTGRGRAAAGRPARARLLGRFRPGRALAELHYRLRSRDASPARQGWAVAVGTFIGCLPLYGLHLVLCLAAAKLFRLSAVRAYLAAHVNNPLTAPLLLYLELGLGRLLLTGRWPTLAPSDLAAGTEGARALTLLGRDLLLGGAVLGAALGAVLGLASWRVARRWRRPDFERDLIDAATRPYVEAGTLHWEMVRGKLRHDPVYLSLLREGALPTPTGGGPLRVLDLGCGRGGALALLATASSQAEDDRDLGSRWPPVWAERPRDLHLSGIERSPKLVEIARRALGDTATIEPGDLSAIADLPPSDAVLLLDVLHYLPAEAQDHLLATVATALTPGGVLLIREADAARGWRFALTRLQERLSALLRGHWTQRFHYRSATDWTDTLIRQALTATTRPMWQSTPFANILITAHKPQETTQPLSASSSPESEPSQRG